MNPLTRFYLFLIFSLSTLFSDTLVHISSHLALCIFILLNNRLEWIEIKKKLVPFLKFFPMTGLFFFVITITVSEKTIIEAFLSVFFATTRLLIVIAAMTIYIVQSKSEDFMIGLRSNWLLIGKSWKWVEDAFLFFEITIRLFPKIQDDFEQAEISQSILSQNKDFTLYRRFKNIAKYIPDFILMTIDKADQISLIVRGRGYGISFPRTVYPFLPLHWYDLIIIIFALILFVLTHFYVTI